VTLLVVYRGPESSERKVSPAANAAARDAHQNDTAASITTRTSCAVVAVVRLYRRYRWRYRVRGESKSTHWQRLCLWLATDAVISNGKGFCSRSAVAQVGTNLEGESETSGTRLSLSLCVCVCVDPSGERSCRYHGDSHRWTRRSVCRGTAFTSLGVASSAFATASAASAWMWSHSFAATPGHRNETGRTRVAPRRPKLESVAGCSRRLWCIHLRCTWQDECFRFCLRWPLHWSLSTFNGSLALLAGRFSWDVPRMCSQDTPANRARL